MFTGAKKLVLSSGKTFKNKFFSVEFFFFFVFAKTIGDKVCNASSTHAKPLKFYRNGSRQYDDVTSREKIKGRFERSGNNAEI